MAKLILIDNSIMGNGGHHYEYALRVIEAASRAGYSPILCTNRKFRPESNVGWRCLLVYRNAFSLYLRFRPPHSYSRIAATLSSCSAWFLQVFYKRLYSSIGFYWFVRKNPRPYLRSLRNEFNLGALTGLAFFAAVSYAFRLARSFANLLDSSLHIGAYLLRMVGIAKTFLGAALKPAIVLLRRRKMISRELSYMGQIRAYAADTTNLFRRVHLQEGDIVFIPNVSEVESIALSSYFRKNPDSIRASWHLLFRSPVYIGTEADYRRQDEGLRTFRNSLLNLQDGSDSRRVFFYTDTDRLSYQYERMSSAKFETLPIPVASELQDLRRRQAKQDTLNIVYIGDARKEKGYNHLPRVVQDLWHDYVEPGRIVFTFQSNLPFVEPEGEPEVLFALEQLQSFPGHKVALIREALSSQEYTSLLLGGDIGLVLYEPRNFYARSSGVFAECLAVGMPIVLPAGTWMAREIADEIHQYHSRIRRAAEIRKSYGLSASSLNQWFRVPSSVSHLLLSIDGERKPCSILVDIAQSDSEGLTISHKTYIGDNLSEKAGASFLVPIERGTRRIHFQLQKAFSNSKLSNVGLRLDYIASSDGSSITKYPLSAVGMIYNDPADIPLMLREIIDNYDHYKTTAVDFSSRWLSRHNPQTLIRRIIDNSMDENEDGRPNRDRYGRR